MSLISEMEQAATFIILNQSANFKSALSGKSTTVQLLYGASCDKHTDILLNVLSVHLPDASINGESIYW